MAYGTWADVAEAVLGEKQLLSILQTVGDNATTHPFLDRKMVLADQAVDNALRQGGWETPLSTPLADENVHSDWEGLVVGAITRSYAKREPWMDNMEKAAIAHLKQIADGTYTPVGVEPEADTTQEALIAGAFGDEPLWDQNDPDSAVHVVFPHIGPARRW